MNFDLRDIPIDSLESDLLDTYNYSNAISQFILQSSAPLTISIQGEWGCGKTSLMKMIEKNICDSKDAETFESIWINTWEFFINNNSYHACEQIIVHILREVIKHKNNHNKSIRSNINLEELKKNLRLYLSNAANITMDVVGISEETKKNTIDIFSDVQLTTISKLRKSIEIAIDEIIQSENGMSNRGFIFFIDDLDRIEPENAIQILEIFKNLFDINHCVFILAIDYEVIIRGLRKKYGELDSKHEMIYRAYFDKLIQLPFTMPIKSYNSIKMIRKTFEKNNYFENYRVEEKVYIELSEIVSRIIRNNPRSWKRFINSLLLSDIIDKNNKTVLNSLENRIINFIFVIIQIGHPKIYSYMLSTPEKLYEYLNDKNDTFVEMLREKLEDEENLDILENFIETLKIGKKIVDDFSECNEIILLSATTNINHNVDVRIQYDGNQYDKSSQTQFKQGNNLIEKILINPRSYVLDIGCGNGKTTIELFKSEPTIKIDAFDCSQSQIEIANINRKKAGITNQEIAFFNMEAIDMNYEEKYDLIFSNAALHWISEGEKMYEKIFYALKKKGVIAIHQGGKDSYRELHEAVQEAIKELKIENYFINWSCPLFYPTKNEMKNLLTKIGFKNINIKVEESQGIEYDNLIDNFANASLLPYLECCKNDAERNMLIKKYKEIAIETVKEVYTHRLYIFAER